MATRRKNEGSSGLPPQEESAPTVRGVQGDAADPDREGMTVYNVSARVMVYSMLCTLMLAVMLCVFMGYLTWMAQYEATELRRALHDSQDTNRTCRVALERMDAKMELVDQWVFRANKLRGSGG